MIREEMKVAPSRDALAYFSALRAACDMVGGQSSKLNAVLGLLASVRPTGEKVIVFSYLLDPLRELGARLREMGYPFYTFTGEIERGARDDVLGSFSTRNGFAVLLASSKIASEGLTLVAANHVIFFNQWWNPSANDQARDRVVRIGQLRDVYVYRLYCPDTIEERLDEILRDKQSTFDFVVDQLSIESLRCIT